MHQPLVLLRYLLDPPGPLHFELVLENLLLPDRAVGLHFGDLLQVVVDLSLFCVELPLLLYQLGQQFLLGVVVLQPDLVDPSAQVLDLSLLVLDPLLDVLEPAGYGPHLLSLDVVEGGKGGRVHGINVRGRVCNLRLPGLLKLNTVGTAS